MDNRHDQSPGVWTTGSLYEHFNILLSETQEKHLAIFREQDKRFMQMFNDLQGQVDRRIEVTNRERQDTERHLIDMIVHIEKAIVKSEANMEKRLEALNKLREAVETDRSNFMQRPEAQAKLDAMDTKIDAQQEVLIRRAGAQDYERRRQQQIQPWQLWVAGTVVTVLMAILVVTVNILTG